MHVSVFLQTNHACTVSTMCVYELCRVRICVIVHVCDRESVNSLSLESCSESGLTGVGSLHERLKLLARRSAKAGGVRG